MAQVMLWLLSDVLCGMRKLSQDGHFAVISRVTGPCLFRSFRVKAEGPESDRSRLFD